MQVKDIIEAYQLGHQDGALFAHNQREQEVCKLLEDSIKYLDERNAAKQAFAKAEAEQDAALARIATLEQQLTDAAGRINELEAPAPPDVRQWDPVQPARKKYEAPEYQPLPDGCEIGEEFRQLAVGETVQEGDEFWSISTERWVPTEHPGRKIKIDQNNIYRRKQ